MPGSKQCLRPLTQFGGMVCHHRRDHYGSALRIVDGVQHVTDCLLDGRSGRVRAGFGQIEPD